MKDSSGCLLPLRFSLSLLSFGLVSVLPGYAANLSVTNLADSGPGTLRDGIAAAAPGDQLNILVPGTIVLNSPLTISKNLTIAGNGIWLTKISGNDQTRVFNITSGYAQFYWFIISNGRVVGTNGPAGFNGENVSGGAIYIGNGASNLLWGVLLSNNVAIGGDGGSGANGGNGFGGGIANYGTLSTVFSTVENNTALGGQGGVSSGVGGQGWGGGLYSAGFTELDETTINANNATAGTGPGGPGGGDGGGMYIASGSLRLLTSTIASNTASGSSTDSGGGIANFGTLTVQSCTISGNQADFGGGFQGIGTFANTILAGNTGNSTNSGPDGSGSFISNDYNLIQTTNGLIITGTTAHNIIKKDPLLGPLQNNGDVFLGFYPQFVTLTMAPLPGSPAIDAGNIPFRTSDERGVTRPYDILRIPNVSSNAGDIGAVEIVPSALLVLNLNDSGPGSLRQAVFDNNGYGGSNIIAFSSNLTGTVTLSTGELAVTVPVTITGPGPDLLAISANHNGRVFDIRDSAQISGLTIRDGLIVGFAGTQGHNGSDGQGGGILNESSLVLSNCIVRSNTVIGGAGSDRFNASVGQGGKGLGGGIYNAAGNLFLFNCLFDGNTSIGGNGGNGQNGDAGFAGNGLGGAICTIVGSNQIAACSLLHNVAMGGTGGISGGGGGDGVGGQGQGGGLYSESSIIVTSSTISGNNAVAGTGGGGNGNGYGGGIYNLADLAMYSSTVASNSATGNLFDTGGGIYNVITLGVTNCTIAGNSAVFGGGLEGDATTANTIFAANAASFGPDVEGTITSFDYNLFQNPASLNLLGLTNHVIVGKDPLLGPLQNNGGPTFTMALLPGSPALDQGTNFGFVTDQRGFFRPYNLLSVANATGGDGTDIGAFEFYPIPRLHIQREPSDVVLSWTSDAADYQLQYVFFFRPTNTWTELTNARTIIGSQVYVTNTPRADAPTQFYRLAFPTAPPVSSLAQPSR